VYTPQLLVCCCHIRADRSHGLSGAAALIHSRAALPMHMWICMCMCMFTWMYMYMHIHIFIWIYKWSILGPHSLNVRTCVYIYMDMYVYVYVMYTYMHVWVHRISYIYTYVYTVRSMGWLRLSSSLKLHVSFFRIVSFIELFCKRDLWFYLKRFRCDSPSNNTPYTGVYTCICMCICICICKYIYIWIHVRTWIRIYVHICILVGVVDDAALRWRHRDS